MENKKDRVAVPAIGGSSLLVIFAVLCLTVFALLSLSTVKAGDRLSDASAEAVAAYYAADCQAEEVLARLRSGENVESVSWNGDIAVYDCPVSQTQTLHVEVRVDGEDYTVLRWQMASTTEWETEDSLMVWDGEWFGEEELP